MKRVLIGVGLLAIGAMLGAGFQARTANAQKLLGNMGPFLGIEQAYSRAFITGDADRLATFWHEDFLGWPTNEDLPWDKEYAVEAVEAWIEDHEGTLSQPMLEPIANRIVGDQAVIHYLLEYIVTNEDGDKTHRKAHVSHFWVKDGSSWKLLGEGMANPPAW